MKTLLFAAALVIAAPAVAQAQVAAGALPNTFDGPAPARATPPVAAPVAPVIDATPANAASESTLRTLIAGMQAGTLDYTLMSDDLADKVREQEATVLSLIQSFGALQTVTFAGRQGGADLFAASFAEAETQWMIGFNEADKVAALLFRPAE